MSFLQWSKLFIEYLPSTLVSLAYGVYIKAKSHMKYGADHDLIFLDPLSDEIIIFIHGRNGTPYHFIQFVEKLEDQQKNILCVHMKEEDILKEAERLKEWLEGCVFKNVQIVGLSKGGVVAMKLASICPLVNKVITISSPLRGTLSANYFLKKDSLDWQQLRYQSDLVIDIESSILQLEDLQIYHIVPKKDYFIYPSESAHYSFTDPENIFQTDSNHLYVQHDGKVVEQVIQWIMK